MKVFGMKADEDRIRRDVVINDAPGPIRYNLTRRVTQDDIARRTGTQIVVRGQYQAPAAPGGSDEPPLFLKVTPGAVSQEVAFLLYHLNIPSVTPKPQGQKGKAHIFHRARVEISI